MVAETYAIDITVPITRYGYFLYVWKATTAQGDFILYVGRTGDDVYTSANPPVVRVGQHLGQGRAAALTNNLRRRGVNAREFAELRVVIHGPIFPPAQGDRDAPIHRFLDLLEGGPGMFRPPLGHLQDHFLRQPGPNPLYILLPHHHTTPKVFPPLYHLMPRPHLPLPEPLPANI